MGKLYYYYGAMGSSKTANALMMKYNYEQSGSTVLLLRPSLDTRSSRGKVESRIGLSSDCKVITPSTNVYRTIKSYKNVTEDGIGIPANIVVVDECQFLTPAQVDEIRKAADVLHISIFCYGLRTNFKTELFEASKRLMELADTIKEVKSVCRVCGEHKAIFNVRVNKRGEVIEDGPEIVCGDAEYIPCCSVCKSRIPRAK